MYSLKSFIFFGLFVLLCWTSSGQDVYLALKGGAQLTGLRYEGSGPAISPSVGWNAGLVACYQPSNSRVGFSVELGYSLKGASIDVDSLDYEFDFVGGPILFDYYLTDRIKISAGPEISLLTNARNQKNDSTTIDISSTFGNQFEFGGMIGASMSLTFFMDLGVRYNMAFSRIADFDPRTQRTDIRTDYVQLYILLKVAN